MWARREIRGLLSRHANSNPRLSAFFHFIARGPKHLRRFGFFKLNSFILISREPRFSSLSPFSPSKNITRILLGLMQTFSFPKRNLRFLLEILEDFVFHEFEEKGCMIKGRCSTRLSYRPAPRPGFSAVLKSLTKLCSSHRFEPGSPPVYGFLF